MTTAFSLQIGNSDNKLTQQEWSEFVFDVNDIVTKNCTEIFFNGGPCTSAKYQNWCWVGNVFDKHSNQFTTFKSALREVRKKYNQDSVALMFGNTDFI